MTMPKYAKAYVTFAYVVLTNAVAQELISGTTGKWVTLVAGAAVTVGVVVTPNKPVE